MDFNGTYYYYLRNGQGDIVKLIDSSGATKVEYTYDSWGKPLSCTGTLATTLGALNPFHYRGYVYDQETGFYYLKSRYYDPETCRFISADVLLSTGQGVIGHNCYAYCLNSPGCMTDDGGYAANGNNTYITADGNSGRMQKKQNPENTTNYTFYSSPDAVAIAIAPTLYEKTRQTNKEYMAAIYSINTIFGKMYFAGPVLEGMHGNVIIPTIGSKIQDILGKIVLGNCVRIEGFVHSHPDCACHPYYNEFSGLIGDQGAAILTGSCYLVDPKEGKIYKITRMGLLGKYWITMDIPDMMQTSPLDTE